MEIDTPSRVDLRRIGDELGLGLTDDELDAFSGLSSKYVQGYRRISELADLVRPSRSRTVESWHAAEGENPGNGWAMRCHIEESSAGSLVGKRLAVKDNISVGGVPMLVGSPVMEGFVPDTDATVVKRAVAAGASIVGKTAVPGFCFDGASITGFPEPQPVNPWRADYCAGGSSGGNAIVLVNDDADMALGTDTAGSIRIPASWSGCCGLKPTFALVPTSGIFPIERSLDHVGPMAKTVLDCALLMDVIAGPNPASLQSEAGRPESFSAHINEDIEGVSLGLLGEGFSPPDSSDPDVHEAVRAAVGVLANHGANVVELSIPMHSDAIAIWAGILFEGASEELMSRGGPGTNWRGTHASEAVVAFSDRRRTHGAALPPTLKLTALIGRYMTERYGGYFYGEAQKLAIALRTSYAEALRGVDVLIMPTTPTKACRLPRSPDTSELFNVAWSNLQNTAPFNVSGHPALSVPCAFSDGLPIGMMIVGRHFDDALVMRIGHAFQSFQGDIATNVERSA